MSDLDAVQQINWNDEMQIGAGSSGDDGLVSAKRQCPGHEVCFSVDETVHELDIPEENISTLLCYLELHDQQYVKALSKAYIRCKVLSYGGAKALKYVFFYKFFHFNLDLLCFGLFCFSFFYGMIGLPLKSVHHLRWLSLWIYEKEFHMTVQHSLSFQ